MGFLANTVKGNTDLSDEVLANNMLAASAASANAYLQAALASATPELKALYSSSLSQVLQGQSALTEVAVKKGWEKPYDPPAQQLADASIKAQFRNDD